MDTNAENQPQNVSMDSFQPVNSGDQQSPVAPAPKPGRSLFKSKLLIIGVTIVVIAGIGGGVMLAGQKPAPKPKVYKVGILDGLHVFFGDTTLGFKEKMSQLGYVEGKNVTYDIQIAKAPVGNQATLKKFVQDNDDLIVAFPTEASLEAKAAVKGTKIPVITLDSSVEGTGLIDTIQHPGNNMTGVRFPGPENSVQRLEILHQLNPSATRILVPYLKDYPNVPGQLVALEKQAKTLGVTLTSVPLAPDAVSSYVASLSTTKPSFDAIVCVADPFAVIPTMNASLFAYADQHNLPVLTASLTTDASGPIVSLAPNPRQAGRLGAPLAVKIFKGASAGNIPMVTPESDLKINLKVAQRLGITPDVGLLSTATKIIR